MCEDFGFTILKISELGAVVTALLLLSAADDKQYQTA